MDQIIGRIDGLALMAAQMQKLDPRFGRDPFDGFIDALVTDLRDISNKLDAYVERP